MISKVCIRTTNTHALPKSQKQTQIKFIKYEDITESTNHHRESPYSHKNKVP